MRLLQFALGFSKFKGESPKDSYSAKPRENHANVINMKCSSINRDPREKNSEKTELKCKIFKLDKILKLFFFTHGK